MHGSVLVRGKKRHYIDLLETMCINDVMMKNFMIVTIYQGH